MTQKPFADLRGLIVSKFGTHGAFAKAMKWSRSTCSAKLNDKVEWTGPEIGRACTLLDIPMDRAHEYKFF
jgi:hypothetical protein